MTKTKYELTYKKSAKKTLHKMDKHDAKQYRKWIAENLEDCENPRFGGIPLKGELKGSWRYDIGSDKRIIVIIDDKARTVEVTKVGHRSTVYETWLLFLMG